MSLEIMSKAYMLLKASLEATKITLMIWPVVLYY